MCIKICNLSKKYKDVIAVNNLNLEIKNGELFSILGLNGAGKTTLIQMLTTIIQPTGGDAYINGYSIVNEGERVKSFIDVSLQETAVARKLTVEENIELYARLNNLSKEDILKRKEFVYNLFDLHSVKNKMACKLSGGWQRKLSIALALIAKPQILFLDEPTLGLDVISRRELWKAINQLKGEMTIILTTHYMEEAEELSDRIGIMKDGKMLFVGNKNELYSLTNENNVEMAFVKLVSGGDFND